MNRLFELLKDIVARDGDSGNQYARQIDAKLIKNGKPVRIMKSSLGLHVAIGDDIEAGPPPPTGTYEALRKIERASR